MDKYRNFKTLVRTNHRLGYKEHVRGELDGIALVMLDTHLFSIKEGRDGHVYTCACGVRAYKKYAKFVEKHYPGLCTFDYEESE